MSWRLLLLLLTPLVLLVFWFVATDLLYCVASFRFDLFQFPFDAWLNDWPVRNHNKITQLRYVGSAALPAIFVVFAISRSWHKIRPLFNGLYGYTGFATRREERRNGITLHRNPFD